MMRCLTCVGTVFAIVAAAPVAARQANTLFHIGQSVEMRLSAGGWRKCIVTDAGDEANYRLARADCEALPTPVYNYPANEEAFGARGSSDVRLPGSCTTTSPYLNQRAIRNCDGSAAAATASPRSPAGTGATWRVAAPAAAPHAPPPAVARNAGGTLPLGEYGCIGFGTTQLAGMGSKLLPGGRYTDLDGRSPGTYRMVGDTIVFKGGHLDGEVGRNVKGNSYNLGKISCQKW